MNPQTTSAELYQDPVLTQEREVRVETQSGDQIITDSLADIHRVETQVTTELGIMPNTPEAVQATDEALADIADYTLNSPDADITDRQDVLLDVLIETADEMGSGATPDQTALAKFGVDKPGHLDAIKELEKTLNETHATLPSGHEAGPLVEMAVAELSSHAVMEAPGAVDIWSDGFDSYETPVNSKEVDQAAAFVSYEENIKVEPLSTHEVIDPLTIARLMETEHAVKIAPTLADQLRDEDRTNKITHISNQMRALGNGTSAEEYQPLQEEMSEIDGLRGLDTLLEMTSRELVNSEAQLNGHGANLRELAMTMRENLTYIGEKEYSEATAGIASYWKVALDNNPQLQICAVVGEIANDGGLNGRRAKVKSDEYMLENILKNFSADELKKYGGRLISDPNQITAAKSEDLKIVLLDDWTISGAQLKSAYRSLALERPEFADSIEVQLVAATESRINGLDFYSSKGTKSNNVPVRTYFLAHNSPLARSSGAHITGSHSSVDFDFEFSIAGMVDALKTETGIEAVMPGVTNIVRPYRKPGFDRSTFTNTSYLAQNNGKM